MQQKKDALHEIVKILKNFPQPILKRFDIFTPGIYTRHLIIPANYLFVSEMHKTEHQYIVSKGYVDVWDTVKGWDRISSPRAGITVPGTQRLFRTYDEDVMWVTIHPTDIYPKEATKEAHEKAVEEITELIIDRSYDPSKILVEMEGQIQ